MARLTIGARVVLREGATLDELGEATAPPPVEPGDLVATTERVLVVEAVLPVPPTARCGPVLAREHVDD